MLHWLHVDNLALIRSLTLEFKPGLSVITGETGSGKSILIQAISTLLGDSVHSQTVQTGYRSAAVEAEFDDVKELVSSRKFSDLGLEMDDTDRLILRREIMKSGRSRYLLNAQVIRKSEFQWIGRSLLDVNSQHSHQDLLKPKHHLGLLDTTLPSHDIHMELEIIHQHWSKYAEKYLRLKREMDDRRRRKQLIEYQLEEIDSARLNPGEKETLISERERLRYAEEIQQNLQAAWDVTEDETSGFSDAAAKVSGFLQRAASKDSRLNEMALQADTIQVMISDLSHELLSALESIEISPDRLEAVSERLHFLQQLEGKFQNDIPGILAYRQEIYDELKLFDSSQDDLNTAETKWLELRDRYLETNNRLSQYRRSQSVTVCRAIEDGLKLLGMKHAQFDISFSDDLPVEQLEPGRIPERYADVGTDQVDFMLSANPGVPLKPLVDIASGGELSRIMLTLKQHLGNRLLAQTSIFDEVDSGIGGDVGNAVARQLRSLAKGKQVICVTHLPQIAAGGDHHYLVEKSVVDNETIVAVKSIDSHDRIEEIARMLSGDQTNSEAMAHARSMLGV